MAATDPVLLPAMGLVVFTSLPSTTSSQFIGRDRADAVVVANAGPTGVEMIRLARTLRRVIGGLSRGAVVVRGAGVRPAGVAVLTGGCPSELGRSVRACARMPQKAHRVESAASTAPRRRLERPTRSTDQVTLLGLLH